MEIVLKHDELATAIVSAADEVSIDPEASSIKFLEKLNAKVESQLKISRSEEVEAENKKDSDATKSAADAYRDSYAAAMQEKLRSLREQDDAPTSSRRP